MTDYLSKIDENYPVRNSAEQKKAFRAYAVAEAKKAGFDKAREVTCEKHENIVFGDPETARVVFTAHYDTPRQMLTPNLMLVTNRFLFWAYNIGLGVIIALISFCAAVGAKQLFGFDTAIVTHRLLMLLVFYAVYFLLFYLMLRGPANRHNRNDNTSGTAAVMELLTLRGEESGAAYILFDDEEKGKKGSKAFAKAYPAVRQDTLVVNLDCVGNGDAFIFSPSAQAEKDPLYDRLRSAFGKDSSPKAIFYPPRKAQMNSDHKSFSKGVGVCACRHKRIVGWYAGRIHTKYDTVADSETVMKLAQTLSDFAGSISRA